MAVHTDFAQAKPAKPIHSGVRIGHVHLKVADLQRALGFYVGVLGFELITTLRQQAAFISAGGYHHHIALNTWESLGGSPPPPGTTGLYHLAILYPTRAELADALRRVEAAGIPLDGASDHGVSEALYLRDPGPQRRRAVLGPPAGSEWPRDAEGRIDDVHQAAEPERAARRSEIISAETSGRSWAAAPALSAAGADWRPKR